jgi:hypothetical protein
VESLENLTAPVFGLIANQGSAASAPPPRTKAPPRTKR